MLRLAESQNRHQFQKTSDMHELSMIFDQQDLVTTNGRVSLHDILGVYQDIYNNNISMDTGSSSVSFMILSAIEQVLFELLSRINVVNIQISSIFLHLLAKIIVFINVET